LRGLPGIRGFISLEPILDAPGVGIGALGGGRERKLPLAPVSLHQYQVADEARLATVGSLQLLPQPLGLLVELQRRRAALPVLLVGGHVLLELDVGVQRQLVLAGEEGRDVLADPLGAPRQGVGRHVTKAQTEGGLAFGRICSLGRTVTVFPFVLLVEGAGAGAGAGLLLGRLGGGVGGAGRTTFGGGCPGGRRGVGAGPPPLPLGVLLGAAAVP